MEMARNNVNITLSRLVVPFMARAYYFALLAPCILSFSIVVWGRAFSDLLANASLTVVVFTVNTPCLGLQTRRLFVLWVSCPPMHVPRFSKLSATGGIASKFNGSTIMLYGTGVCVGV